MERRGGSGEKGGGEMMGGKKKTGEGREKVRPLP